MTTLAQPAEEAPAEVKSKRGRKPARELKGDTDLGNTEELMRYMGLRRTYMSALKRCADMRDSKDNPSCYVGNMSCKQWILEWLLRNRDFKTTLVYPIK